VLLPQVDLAKLHPEAPFAIPGTDLVQILSDDGAFRTRNAKVSRPPTRNFAASSSSLERSAAAFPNPEV